MFERIVRPKQRTESSRIPETQRFATVELDIYMIVLAGGFVRVDDANAARHPQVQHCRACVGLEQQVLCAAPERLNNLPGQFLVEDVARGVTYGRPRIGFVSNLDPGPVDDALTTPDYWVRHVREPVLADLLRIVDDLAGLGTPTFPL